MTSWLAERDISNIMVRTADTQDVPALTPTSTRPYSQLLGV